MKNDIFPTLNSVSNINCSPTPQFSNAVFSIPVSIKNDSYIIETINANNVIISSLELETKDLKEGLIYRNNIDGVRFWTQILKMNEKPFMTKNFYNYYDKFPEEYYTLYIEIIKMNNLKASDVNGLSDPYYICKYGNEIFKSRTIYYNLNPIFYDEFQFRAKNLDCKLIISVYDKDLLTKDDFLGKIEIDLTSEPFGKVVEKEYNLERGSIEMKWQVTEPCQIRWSEKIFNLNVLNIFVGKYESLKNCYEFWKIKLDDFVQQTIITPCGAFNEIFSFILTNQTEIIFEKYYLDSENNSKLINTVPINFSKLEKGPFNIIDDLYGLMEIVPYGSIPFNGQQQCPLSFYTKSTPSISIIIYEAKDLDGDLFKPPDPYIKFKFKDRNTLNEKSILFKSTKDPIWNQYFNFEVKSISTDILEVYVMDKDIIKKDDKLKKINFEISNLLNGKITKEWYNVGEKGKILIQTQFVPPNIEPFTEYLYEPENIYIKFLDGENLSSGDLYCCCKLTNDISWKKTKTIKCCSNPQWLEIIKLPITDLSCDIEIQIRNENLLIKDSINEEITIKMNEMSNNTIKKVSTLKKGSIFYLIQMGKSNITPFSDYKEIEEKITANNLMLGIKVVEAKNLKIGDFNSSDPYCIIKIAGVEKRTRVIDSNLNPVWNQTFYFDVTSYSTNELSFKIYDKDKLKKDDLLYELNIPIKKLPCGVVEDKWYDCVHLITHLMKKGQISFESEPFNSFEKMINIQSLKPKENVFCLIQQKGDEFWRYTKPNNFSDYFKIEYIDNLGLTIKSSDTQNISEEITINISEENDQFIDNSLGKYKISFIKEIKPFTISPIWNCNIYVKEIEKIKKKKDILWLVEINKISLGYTYDGIINKYISININSLQTDEIELILYKIEIEKDYIKKEYGKGSFKINNFKIGKIEESVISLKKTILLIPTTIDQTIKLSLHITPPNYEPFINKDFYPLIMHIYVIEALNVPKMDLTSNSDPYVIFKFEKDKIGIKTKALSNTLTPQWNELVNLIITDSNEDLFIEMWDKNVTKDKFISSTKINIKKYLNGEAFYEWIKLDKILLNLAIQIKREGEDFITQEDVNIYQLSTIPNIE